MKKLSVMYCFLIVLFTACDNQKDTTIEVVTPEEMQSLIGLDNVQMIDVRSRDERLKHGYIANSQHIDYNSDSFEEDIKNLDKNKPVALYCHTGRSSAKCAEKLKAAGFVKVFDLQGGFSEWEHQGNEVIR